jgi:hypothetical protein
MAKGPTHAAHSGGRASERASAAKRFKSRSLWRLVTESRVAAWSLLGLVVLVFVAMIALGIAISVGRHRCADLCTEREYAFKDYAPAGRFGTRPPVCTCSKEGVSIEMPMR